MKINQKTVAFIPVRGGSKSIPLKNITIIAGKPLVHWTIEAALNCDAIEHVYVATDSNDIRACVNAMEQEKVSVIGRSPETCTDEASSESALLEFCTTQQFDQVFFIQATSPLLTSADLTNAWIKYQKNDCDSMLSLVRQKHFIWRELEEGGISPINYDPLQRPRRQDFSGYLMENGAFYISKRLHILESGCRISGKIDFYEMPEETYIDLDEPIDWLITEQILTIREKKKQLYLLKNVRMLLTDVDGVLTDSGMYYTETGDEYKKFNTKDGMGLQLLKNNNIKVGIITGENRELVRRRAEKLNIDELYMGARHKEELLDKICAKYGFATREIAYVGDDINDIGIMKKVGVAFSVADGMECVKDVAHYVTKAKGGQGAVREIAEMIISSHISARMKR